MDDFVSGKILDFILNNVETVGITVKNRSGINRILSEDEEKTHHEVTIKGKSFSANFKMFSLGFDYDCLNNKRNTNLIFHVTDKTKKGSEAFAELITILSDQYTSGQLNIDVENRNFHNFARNLELVNMNGIDLLTSLNYDERKKLNYYVHNYPLKRELHLLDEIMKVSLITFEDIEINSELLSLIKENFLDITGTENVVGTGLIFNNCRIAKNCDWTILRECNIIINNSNINLDDFEYSCNSFSFCKCNISQTRFLRFQMKELDFSDCKIDLPNLFLTATANNLDYFSFDVNYDIEDELDNLKYFAPNLKKLILGKTLGFEREGKIRNINFFSGFKYLTDINLFQFGYENPYCMLVEFTNPVKTAERYTNCKNPSAPFYKYEYVPFNGYFDMCEKQKKFNKKDANPRKLYADKLFDLEMARAGRINSLCRTMYNTHDRITQKEMYELLFNYEGYVKSDEFLKNDGYYDWYLDGLILREYEKNLLSPECDIQLNWPYFNIPHEILEGSNYETKWRQAIGFAINSVTGIPIRLRIKRKIPQFHEYKKSEENIEFINLDYHTQCALSSLEYKYKKWTEMRTNDAPFVVSYPDFSISITSEFLEQNFPNLTYLIGQVKTCENKIKQDISQTSSLEWERGNLEREIIQEIESHLDVLTVPEVVFLMTRIEHSESESRILKYQKYNSILSKAVTKLDFSSVSDKSIAEKIGQDIFNKYDELRNINHCLRELYSARSGIPKIVIDDETARELFQLSRRVMKTKHI